LARLGLFLKPGANGLFDIGLVQISSVSLTVDDHFWEGIDASRKGQLSLCSKFDIICFQLIIRLVETIINTLFDGLNI